jgi:hypothetical protein
MSCGFRFLVIGLGTYEHTVVALATLAAKLLCYENCRSAAVFDMWHARACTAMRTTNGTVWTEYNAGLFFSPFLFRLSIRYLGLSFSKHCLFSCL